ncbi:MAG: hypothetical protein WDZ79_01115 [Candidatus Paceibacterota bacterium]
MSALQTFPEVTFWSVAAPKLKIVNEGDLQIERLLAQIGLADLSLTAVTDGEEISRRQDTLRALMLSPELTHGTIYRVARQAQVPTADDWSFIRHFEEHHFWNAEFSQVLDELVRVTRDAPGTDIRRFVDFLVNTRTEQRRLEDELSGFVISDMRRMAEFSGIATVRNGKVEHEDCIVGQHCFHYDTERLVKAPPSWARDPKNSFMELLAFLRSIPIERHNRRMRELYFQPQLITELPRTAAKAITAGVSMELARITEASGLARDDLRSVPLRVGFKYQHGEMRIWFLDVTGLGGDEGFNALSTFPRSQDVSMLNYHLLPIQQRHEISVWHARLVDRLSWALESKRASDVLVGAESPLVAGEGLVVDDTQLNHELRWRHVGEVIKQNPDYNRRFQQIEAYRAYVSKKLRRLAEVAQIAQALNKSSKEWGLPTSFPRVLPDNEHLVSFSRLYPTQLIGRKKGEKTLNSKSLVPIDSRLSMNGQIIGLTGSNAGGKTVVQESMAHAIYMAHCGLPIFGHDMQFNPKSILALAFLERGEGSTLELMAEKLNRIVETAEKADANKMVAILDELGTGTQMDIGMELGQRVISRLRATGCSVMFSTQITHLAVQAQEQHNAHVFGIDLKHRLSEGVRGGNVDELLRDRRFSALQRQ